MEMVEEMRMGKRETKINIREISYIKYYTKALRKRNSSILLLGI